MLTISQPGRIMNYTMHWFSKQPPSPLQAWRPMMYWCCHDSGEVAGFQRQEVATRIVALDQPWEQIESALPKNTAYEMRRAARDGVKTLFDTDMKTFIDFYQAFALQKGLGIPRYEQLNGYLEHATIGKALVDDTALVMNFYLMDPQTRRVRMLYSASHFRAMLDASNRYFVGRANRFLHGAAMRHFQSQDMLHYDLGGYALESQDPALVAINRFKESIGGTLVQEVHYISWMLRLAQDMRVWLTKQ